MSQETRIIIKTTILVTAIILLIGIASFSFWYFNNRSMTLLDYCVSKGMGIGYENNEFRCITEEEWRQRSGVGIKKF